MRVMRFVKGPELREEEAARPQPGRGEVLVRVRAAGITTSELQWYPTTRRKDGSVRTGAVPSHEFAGTVVEAGEGVTGFAAGEDVFGMNDWFADGALAELVVAPMTSIARKPDGLSYPDAAAVPISALTAWQGLFQRAKLRAGESVLVQGGAGAVGGFAVQLARWKGARVFATASARNLERVRRWGAERVIDRHSERFEDIASGMDVVFDGVGGETLERSWRVLKPGGRMVAIAADGEATEDERVKQAFFIVEPDGVRLGEIGEMLERGVLEVAVDAVVPWEQAATVYAGGPAARRGYGKLVVEVARG